MLVENGKDAIVDAFDRTCDEQTPRLCEPWCETGVLQQVLDLYRDVVGEHWPALVHGLRDLDGMARCVEEVGVAEGDKMLSYG